MKKLYFCLVLLLAFLWANAIPAKRDAVVVYQPDGTALTVYNHGDEHFHYMTDNEGRWLTQNENGKYVQIPALTDEQIAQRRMRSPKLQSQMRKAQQEKVLDLNIAKHGLIILANFQDVKFNSKNTLASMQEMHSGDNYTFNGATGSCRRYFYDQSNGAYNPQFDVVGPITLPNNMKYYGENNRSGDDIRPGQMIVDACNLAHSEYNIDFTQYDNDNDGYVDFVYVIYAGYSEAEGAAANTIWPHAWDIESQGLSLSLDRKKISNYACGSELQGTSGSTRSGIGTFCHEFSHVLGLPDLYVTDGIGTHKTLGAWDILDYGPYNNNSNTPPSYSSYERYFMGWLKPEYINKPDNLTLSELQSSNKAFIVTTSETPNFVGHNPTPNVFYMLENRQQTSWDKYLPWHGMMITRVVFDYDKWIGNYVNNNSQSMGVDIIEAGGESIYGGDLESDLFPTGATSYKGIIGREITDIQEKNGLISFKFMGGIVNETLTFNYAQASYDSVYNSSKGYSWEVGLFNITTTNYDYDLFLYFSFYTARRYALTGTYTLANMDYAGIIKIDGTDTTTISLSDLTATFKYVNKDVNGYDVYKISVKAEDTAGNTYSFSDQLTIYGWDNATNERLLFTDEKTTPSSNSDLTFNHAQALNLSNYNQPNNYYWEIDLFNVTDAVTNMYNRLLFFCIATPRLNSIAGKYTIEDMVYSGIEFIDGTDTTIIEFTTCTATIKFVDRRFDGLSVYDIEVKATDKNGNEYNTLQRLVTYCWDDVTGESISMQEIESGVGNYDVESIATKMGNSLIITAQGDVQIVDLVGQMIYSGQSDGSLTIDNLPKSRVLIVRVGNRSQKIVI